MRWIVLLFCSTLCALKLDSIETLAIEEPTVIPITLEHAVSFEEKVWGLMRRKSLPKNHGMTFNYPYSQNISCWMFNCFMDLSLAYLDEEKVIRETYELKSHPEKMDPKRPVKKFEDLKKYPSYDPIRVFFLQKSVPCTFLGQFALEMDTHWFEKNNVKSGDMVLWNVSKFEGTVLLTVDVSDKVQNNPVVLTFSENAPHSVWAPTTQKNLDFAFINNKGKVVSIHHLNKNSTTPNGHKHVFYSKKPVQYILVAKKGWLTENQIEPGSYLSF